MERKINFNKNYYEILSVSTTACDSEIRMAYYNKMKQFFNNQFVGLTPAESEMLLSMYLDINEAKEILFDSEQKKIYDEYLQKNNEYDNFSNEEVKLTKTKEYSKCKQSEDEKKKKLCDEIDKNEDDIDREIEKDKKINHESHEKVRRKIAYIILFIQVAFYLMCGGHIIAHISGLMTIALMVSLIRQHWWSYVIPFCFAFFNLIHFGIACIDGNKVSVRVGTLLSIFILVEMIVYLVLTKVIRNNYLKHILIVHRDKTVSGSEVIMTWDGVIYYVHGGGILYNGPFKDYNKALELYHIYSRT